MLGKWHSSYLNAIWFNKSYPSHVRVLQIIGTFRPNRDYKTPKTLFTNTVKCMLFELEAKLGVKTCD